MIGKLTRTIVRTFAFALALCATSGAWAADSLEETGGVLSAVGTDTLAFKGVTLSELTAETLHGRMSGDWAGTAATESFTFNNFDRSNEGSGSITCQAQLENDGYLKGMVLKFTQSGDDINVQIVSAGAVNGGSIGGSVAGQTGSNSHYAIYNLFLTRTWSDSAVVIWEAGQFGVLSKTGSDGNTYTLNLNSNSNGSGEAITIDQSLGATIDFSSAFAAGDGGTVLIRYSNLPLDTTQRAIVTTKCGSNNDRTGVWINTDATAGKTGGVWGGADYNSTGNTRTTLGSNKSAGVMAFTYHHTDGSYLYYLANGVKTTQHGDSGLKGKNDTISGIAIGGTRATSTTGTAATGMKITGIAIFKGVLTESEMNSFVWPSAKEKYSKFSYISAARRLTWTTASTVTGDNLPNASTQYTVFDINSGDETGTKYTSGTEGNGSWRYLCQGQTSNYAAPGSLLRFKAGDYVKSLAGSFSPLTLGGIIVEEGATGYNFADASRYSNLGDPTNTAETYFDFYEDFTFGRNSGCHLDGTINITVASGKTFTISGSATTYASTSMSGNNIVGTAGGTLKLHGGGHLAATLTASGSTLDYTDLPATVPSTSDAFIQGTVTVDSSTVIALPAGATFPYYVATGISGSLNVATGVTIGGVAKPYCQANAAGYIEYVAPSEVTISSDATWGSGDLAGWATDDSTKDYIINVTADATLTLPSAVSCKTIVFNVSDGVTLTLDGTYAITATDEIEINGANGAVVSPSTSALSGTLQGNGVYWLKNATLTGFSAATIADADLTFRLTGCTGYFNGNTTSPGTLDLQDDGETKAFTISNCSSSTAGAIVFAKLTGSGTLTHSNANVYPRYAFKDPSAFRGTISIPAGSSTYGTSGNRPLRVILGDGASLDTAQGSITIVANATATIDAGVTWSAPAGGIVVSGSLTVAGNTATPITVNSGGSATVSGTASGAIADNGTLTLGDAATVSGAISGSGEVVCTVLPDNAGLADSSGWTGTVTVKSEAYNPLSGLTEHTSISFMNANSRLHAVLGDGVSVGFVQLMSASGLTGLVDIDQNVTLYINDTTSSSISFIAGDVNGSVSMDSCTATTLNLTLGSARPYITYPTTLTKLSISATETLADDGVYTQTITGLSSLTTTTMTLTKLDGTVENLTGTVEGSTLTFSWTPTVSGAACWVDYEMNGSNANTGTEGTAFSYDVSYTAGNSFYDSKFLYTYTHPYRNDLDAYPDSWTAVVRCTVPNLANAAIITFGNQTSGLIGLIAGDNPGSEMKLIQTTGNSAYSTKATMTVQDATSAQHVYVFAVENKRTLKCWCDGTQVLNENLAADISIGNGFQIGSVVYGVGNTGIVRWWPGDTAFDNLDADVKAAARIDCLRLYKGVLGPNAIAQLSVEFPAVKLFQATIAGGNDNEWDSLSWTGGDISTLNEYSKIILTVTDDATLTLPATVTAEEFTINVAAGKTLTLLQAAGGTTFTLTNPIEVNNGSLQFPDDATIDFAINGTGMVRVDDGETLNLVDGGSVPGLTGAGTLDCSSMSALPGAFTFNSWTGTVSLPSFNASTSGVNFNNYGTTGSTVALAGMTGGYILEAGKTVNPTLRLDGDMSITAMSSWKYTFTEITGTGNLSFSTSANSPTVAITKVAEGYLGTISSTLENSVTIGKLNLSTLPACDDKVLAVGGTGEISLDVSNIKYGVNEESLPAKYKLERRHVDEEGDGFYVYYNGTIFSVW